MLDGQTQQVGIGNLAMSDQILAGYAHVEKRDIVGPECVVFPGHDLPEKSHRFIGRHGFGNDLWIGRNADKCALCQRTGCPATAGIPGEPCMREPVVKMRWPSQGDQHIHVQETCAHASSSSFRTSSKVMVRAPRDTEKTGKPLFVLCLALVVEPSPSLARSEIAFPMDSDFSRARFLATANRSSSIVSVVLMAPI